MHEPIGMQLQLTTQPRMTAAASSRAAYGMGCTDENACNYDVEATINDGSCETATAGYDCSGECVSDADGDGVCDQFEVGGCTDMGANNYEPGATDNNGTCTYDSEGCMDQNAHYAPTSKRPQTMAPVHLNATVA